MNSYQKLKKKYETEKAQMLKDIDTLMYSKNQMEVDLVKYKYMSNGTLAQSVFYGEVNNSGEGLIKSITIIKP